MKIPECRRAPFAEWLLFLGFLIGIAVPTTTFILMAGGEEAVLRENRKAAPFPEWSWQPAELSGFPREFEAWYGDSFGLRNLMLRGYSALQVFGLGLSPSDTIHLGADYSVFSTEQEALTTHRGALPFTVEELQHWKLMLEARHDWLAERGTRFLYVCVPSKTELYPELLQPYLAKRGPTRRDQLLEYLREHSYVQVVDLMPALAGDARQDKPTRHAYYPLGIHWTRTGAFVGCQEIVRALRTHFPALQPDEASDFRLELWRGRHDDWTHRMYVAGLLHQQESTLTPLAGPLPEPAVKLMYGKEYGKTTWLGEDPELPHVLLFHDSFGEALLPYLARHCSRLDTSRTHNIVIDTIDDRWPDVVILLYNERNLVSWDPTLGADDQADLRRRFDASQQVLLTDRTLRVGSGISPLHGAVLERITEAEGGGVLIRTTGQQESVLLPPVDYERFEGLPVLELDITSPMDGEVRLFYKNRERDGYSRHFSFRGDAPAGRARILIPLSSANLVGRLLLRPGGSAGDYVLHGLEVRSVSGLR